MCNDGFFCMCCTGSRMNEQSADDNQETMDQNSTEMEATGGRTAEAYPVDPGPGNIESARRGRPAHIGPVKQLHSNTSYNLAINEDGLIYGTREPYNNEAVLEVRSIGPSEVQIRGKASQLYVAMNHRGRLYAEEDPNCTNTIWYERFDNGWNSYVLKSQRESEWFLGIKKSGKIKKGPKTKAGQKAVRFIPRPAYPQNY